LSTYFPHPTVWTQLTWRLKPVRRERLACPGFASVAANMPPEVQTFVSDSYPRNHTYTPVADRLVHVQRRGQ
jgi:hypothetical protein